MPNRDDYMQAADFFVAGAKAKEVAARINCGTTTAKRLKVAYSGFEAGDSDEAIKSRTGEKGWSLALVGMMRGWHDEWRALRDAGWDPTKHRNELIALATSIRGDLRTPSVAELSGLRAEGWPAPWTGQLGHPPVLRHTQDENFPLLVEHLEHRPERQLNPAISRLSAALGSFGSAVGKFRNWVVAESGVGGGTVKELLTHPLLEHALDIRAGRPGQEPAVLEEAGGDAQRWTVRFGGYAADFDSADEARRIHCFLDGAFPVAATWDEVQRVDEALAAFTDARGKVDTVLGPAEMLARDIRLGQCQACARQAPP